MSAASPAHPSSLSRFLCQHIMYWLGDVLCGRSTSHPSGPARLFVRERSPRCRLAMLRQADVIAISC
jgi:hypothetical protein